MTSKFITFRHLAVAGFACLLAASCSDGMDGDSNALPDGTYPMTFTAAVDGLTATRATTTDGATSWVADDQVAISADGGTNHKVYKITDASSGAMSPDNSGSSDANTLYWSKTTETLAAWHPVGCTIGSGSGEGEVSITDQSSGFGTLENILHSPAKQYSYSNSSGGSNGTVAFTFRHALAKVKVTLQAGDGITADDLSTATVAFMGYTAGTLGYNGLTVASGSTNGAIKSKKETVTPSDGSGTNSTTYTALLIPQQMQNKQFIKVTVGTGDAARDYYYTPTSSTDANLEAGKQYAYTITVKKTGLAVTVTDNGVSWSTGTDITDGTTSTIENYTLTITDKSSLNSLTVTGSDGTTITAESDGSYKIPAASGFSVKYTSSEHKQSLIPTSGLCRMSSRSGESQNGSVTYTCHYSSVLSDVTLELKEYVEIGDFYYSDGSWSAPFSLPSTTAANSPPPTVIGIVMKVGRGTDEGGTGSDSNNANNWKDTDSYKQKDGSTAMNTIHGYVLALYDANDGNTCTWGSSGTQVSTNTKQHSLFCGYSNTQTIKQYATNNSKTLSSDFPAAYYATVDYETRESGKYASPSNSSGWFLPSAGQCWYWYQNRDLLLASMKKATGNNGYNWNNWYWSSSEYSSNPANNAWFAGFKYGGVGYNGKGYGGYVRACLAF